MTHETKILELRDRMTFIPLLAIRIDPVGESQEQWLMRRAGYIKEPYILLHRLAMPGTEMNCEFYDRTLSFTHDYLSKHWDIVHSGDVIDVEYLKEETEFKKLSERFDETSGSSKGIAESIRSGL